jgi:hypothetical protein
MVLGLGRLLAQSIKIGRLSLSRPKKEDEFTLVVMDAKSFWFQNNMAFAFVLYFKLPAS